MALSQHWRQDVPQMSSDWLRLRVLIMLRWVAIVGQLVAILGAAWGVGLQFEVAMCLIGVAASALFNIGAMWLFPPNKRLSEVGLLLTLLFDITQLSVLLYLSGGLSNPFALLILAPVTISASALPLRSTALLAVIAVGLVTLLAGYSVPLQTSTGDMLAMPPLLAFGFWLAIVTGIFFLGSYSWRVATEAHIMSQALLATQMALGREQKLTDLGGVIAAAAHELGTPLATIKLVSTEMVRDLADQPALAEDAELIRQEADRCRYILRSMGRAGKDDLHIQQAPLSAVLQEAAEPHALRGKVILFGTRPLSPMAVGDPSIRRRPELIHGLRNLIQNAVDFAQSTVWVDMAIIGGRVHVQIRDDGPGFPPALIGRMGEPFMRSRSDPRHDVSLKSDQRPGYEGMGLGTFIARTLLERTGAIVQFSNASMAGGGTAQQKIGAESGPRLGALGAVVDVVWPLSAIEYSPKEGLGDNKPITI